MILYINRSPPRPAFVPAAVHGDWPLIHIHIYIYVPLMGYIELCTTRTPSYHTHTHTHTARFREIRACNNTKTTNNIKGHPPSPPHVDLSWLLIFRNRSLYHHHPHAYVRVCITIKYIGLNVETLSVTIAGPHSTSHNYWKHNYTRSAIVFCRCYLFFTGRVRLVNVI